MNQRSSCLLRQVGYTGVLQRLLSPGAMSLLVCDTKAFGEGDSGSSDGHQLKRDLAKLHDLRVCDWLRALSLRIPDSDVVVVATKCDLAGGKAADLARRMERAIRTWLEDWRSAGMVAVRVENVVSLTSCVASSSPREERRGATGTWACDWRATADEDSFPSLPFRLMYNGAGDRRGAAMVLPRGWHVALQVLEALGSGW